MDVSRAESAKRELDWLIEKRHDRRVQDERRELGLWEVSSRVYAAKRQRDLAEEWYAHEMKMCDVHAALSEERRERAQKYRQNGHHEAERERNLAQRDWSHAHGLILSREQRSPADNREIRELREESR